MKWANTVFLSVFSAFTNIAGILTEYACTEEESLQCRNPLLTWRSTSLVLRCRFGTRRLLNPRGRLPQWIRLGSRCHSLSSRGTCGGLRTIHSVDVKCSSILDRLRQRNTGVPIQAKDTWTLWSREVFTSVNRRAKVSTPDLHVLRFFLPQLQFSSRFILYWMTFPYFQARQFSSQHFFNQGTKTDIASNWGYKQNNAKLLVVLLNIFSAHPNNRQEMEVSMWLTKIPSLSSIRWIWKTQKFLGKMNVTY